MALVQIEWRPDGRALRKFGASMLVGFGLIGAALYFGWPVAAAPAAAFGAWGFGAAAGLLGLSGTRAALPVYWAWMGVAFVLGNIMSRVVLAVTWYVVVTPIGLLGRLTGRDRLALRRGAGGSYWVDLPRRAERGRYERQF